MEEGQKVQVCVTSPQELHQVADVAAQITGRRFRRQHYKYEPGSSRLQQLPWRLQWIETDHCVIAELQKRLEGLGIGFHVVCEDVH